jgi:SPX domain protein involved in polyphosphate accumulation
MMSELIEQADVRYERKFLVADVSRDDVELAIKLHPAMFFEAYESRYVNSIYFDTHDLDNYGQNMQGSSERMKVRIRWYGELFGLVEKPILEFKIKRGVLHHKISIPIRGIELQDDMDFDHVMESVETSQIPEVMKLQVGTLEPSLCTRYARKYYQSSDGEFRITLDFDIGYYRLQKYGNTFNHTHVDNINSILEMKYRPENDDKAERISNCFPFRMTKSSKYAQGIENIYMS